LQTAANHREPSNVTEAATNPVNPALATLAEVLGAPPKTTEFKGNLRVYVPAERIVEVLTALRDRCGFNFLVELGGVDYLGYPKPSGSGKRFEVHYALLNHETNDRLIVKVGADDPSPSVPSVVSLWSGANWMEREVYDMYGVSFIGHPDMRRILMPDEFTAYPLRKDYPLRGRGERHNFPVISRDQS
jgi:NADH-quinone oxidoreductase subunit C